MRGDAPTEMGIDKRGASRDDPALNFNNEKGESNMSVAKEFQEFAVKGNMIDMAVGIIIGGAFGKIVSSLVNDVIMPPIGLLLGDANFADLAIVLKEKTATTEPVVLKYGLFLNTVLDFVILAFVIFVMVKQINRLRRAEPPAPEPEAPATPEDVLLLREIRDSLKK